MAKKKTRKQREKAEDIAACKNAENDDAVLVHDPCNLIGVDLAAEGENSETVEASMSVMVDDEGNIVEMSPEESPEPFGSVGPYEGCETLVNGPNGVRILDYGDFVTKEELSRTLNALKTVTDAVRALCDATIEDTDTFMTGNSVPAQRRTEMYAKLVKIRETLS